MVDILFYFYWRYIYIYIYTYIKDTNHLFRKIKELGQLLEESIPCIIDVVGLYLNIPHDESLTFLKEILDSRSKRSQQTPWKNLLNL